MKIDQLINSLVSLLRDADPASFDNAVEQAKARLTAETTQAQKANLEKLFDSQIATLKDRGVPEQIIETLANQKGAVIQKASGMAVGEWNIPFLPVIPRSYLSPHSQMAMVKNNGKSGYTHLNPNKITDEVKTLDEPYYIYDVEDGTATLGKSPENAEKVLKRQNRFSFTAAEIMALIIHTGVLSRHYVWAAASRYGGPDGAPNAYLDDGGRPWLGWGDVSGSDGRWGSPSAGSR